MGESLSKDGDKADAPRAQAMAPDSKPTQTSQAVWSPSSAYVPLAPVFERGTGKSIKPDSRFTLIGLMSGTSFDGIDAAVLVTDGKGVIEAGLTHFSAYSDTDRTVLQKAMAEAKTVTRPNERTGLMAKAEAIVTDRHATVVKELMDQANMTPEEVDAIAFHGQTVIHRPDLGFTVQLGDAHRLAGQTGVPVIFDLRSNDMAHGGQGAPLVPVYHQGLARSLVWDQPVAFVNIGGVSNVSFVAEETLLSFDVGPGNALIDDWVVRHTGQRFDEDGALAASGMSDDACLAQLLNNPYFAEPAPKSLDRNAFSLSPVDGLDAADGAATLTAFTAHALSQSAALLPSAPALWVISGGGARNAHLMKRIADLIPAQVKRASDLGVDGDFVEAQAFAYLGVRALKALPLTYPTTTGTTVPVTGGRLALP